MEKVILGTSKTLTLSSGDYYFSSVSIGGSGKLNLNINNNSNIRIFVTGDVRFGTSVHTTISNVNPANIYLETEGNFS